MPSMLPTLQDLLQKSTAYLRERGIDNARRESEWMFCQFLGLERLELYTRYDMPLDEQQVATLRQQVMRRGKREPLAYVLGTQPFRELELQVSPAVLVPRPETEDLVEQILQDQALAAEQALRVADIGTGSGAIALSLAQSRPSWELHACELSEAALAVAKSNGERLGLSVHWHQGHLAQGLDGSWDLLVANLPYISDAERNLCCPETAFEPQVALFADDDGLALILELLDWAVDHLAATGLLWLEHGFRQADRLADACQQRGLHSRCQRDFNEMDRYTRVWR